ncbi:MAG TPA: hypothetical protein VLD60_11615 [Nitrospira sp.]|nr:hypothetical protein [Nitrospira sp.]
MADMNPWKLTSIGLVVVGITAGVTAYVMGGKNSAQDPASTQQSAAQQSAARETAAKPQHKATPVQHSQPPESVVLACNKQAEDQVASKTEEMVKDAALGAAITAGVGAAAGAIADGGKGAGKGAAIGGVVGAAGGTLYGLNENKTRDERFRAAYASCLQAKGYRSSTL